MTRLDWKRYRPSDDDTLVPRGRNRKLCERIQKQHDLRFLFVSLLVFAPLHSVCSVCSCECSNCTQVPSEQDDRDLVRQLLSTRLPSNCSALCLRWDVDLKSLRAKSRTHLLFLDRRRKQSGSKHISADESCKITRLRCLALVSLFVLPEFAGTATKQGATWQLFFWLTFSLADLVLW